jgi:serine/threonine-protein kinase
VAVPAVVGHRLPDAVSLLRQAGLAAVVAHVRSEQPTGRVVAQSPAAGAKQAKGGRVRLEVSVQPPVVVPDVVGMKGLAANHTLQADHLVAFLRYVPSSQPARTVVAQHPIAGTKVRRGSHVEINISKGGRTSTSTAAGTSPPSTVSVPDVVGEDQATATSDLEAAGFTVDTVQTPTTDPTEDGIVLDQSPAGGSKTSASTVTIDIGSYSSG